MARWRPALTDGHLSSRVTNLLNNKRHAGGKLTRMSLLAMAAACFGCGEPGPNIVPVRGVVLADGRPVPDAAVLFVPVSGGRPAEAVTDENGAFELTTLERGDGALVGEHRVAVVAGEVRESTVDGAGAEVSRTPTSAGRPRTEFAKYANAATSGLRQVVSPGIGAIELVLE